MSILIKDIKYGLRVLCKNPGFTAVAVISLALGIGAGKNLGPISFFSGLIDDVQIYNRAVTP